MSNTRISVPFIKNETIAVSKLYHVSLQLEGFSILRGKIGWGGVKMKGKKQDSKNAKGGLLGNGWGTLQSGGNAPPEQGFLFTFVHTEVTLGGGLYSSVHREVTKAD